MTKRIEVRKLSELPQFNLQKVCVCPEVLSYFEPYEPSRADIKKARQISTNINDICIALVHIGARTYVMAESCSFLHRFILFNAEKVEKEGLKVFVKSTLSSEKLFKERVIYSSGQVL